MKLQTIVPAAAAVLLMTWGAVSAQTVEATPGAAAVVPVAPASSTAFEILRTGDRELSCEALGTEFNSLTDGISQQRAEAAAARQRLAADQQAKSKRRGLGMGLVKGALSAASLGGFGTGFEGMMAANTAVTAMDAAQGLGQLKDLIGAYRGAPSNAGEPTSPQQQRLERVATLFKDKGC